MKRNDPIIKSQVQLLKQIIQSFTKNTTSYALLDFPDHSNVGDSAIWLGEIKLLTELTGHQPAYVCKIENFDENELVRAVPSGPIFLHGGGNFGDIWRKHQVFREAILAKFKDRLIVQLPQSIKFIEANSITECATVIAAHPNFHLLVRDQNSLEFARLHFKCNAALVPDSAFVLGGMKRIGKAKHDIFILLRTDVERSTYDQSPFISANAICDDWLIEKKYFRRISRIKAEIRSLIKGKLTREDRRLAFYQSLATGRLHRGLRALSQGKRVITDRLHAHILSTLLDIPHVALDNNYGKIFGYIHSWTKGYPGVDTADDAHQALVKLALLPKNEK